VVVHNFNNLEVGGDRQHKLAADPSMSSTYACCSCGLLRKRVRNDLSNQESSGNFKVKVVTVALLLIYRYFQLVEFKILVKLVGERIFLNEN